MKVDTDSLENLTAATLEMNKPILLYVDNDLNTFCSHRLSLAQAAASAGFSVHLAAPLNGARSEPISSSGIAFHPIPLHRKSVAPWSEISTVRALYQLYRSLKPDIVHHLRLKPVIYGGAAARLAGIGAVVHSVTGLGYAFTSPSVRARCIRTVITAGWQYSLANRNQIVLVENNEDQRLLLKHTPCSPQLVPGAGVDPSAFPASPEPSGTPIVMLPARLLWDKGVREFVEAASLLRPFFKSRFVLVGKPDPGNRNSIPEAVLRAWTEAGLVECWGWQSDMLQAYQQCAVVCLPSYREGIPRTLVEAGMVGRPLVSANTPGCREAVKDGINGFLVPPRQSSPLAVALARLLGDPILRRRMGAASRTLMLDTFSLNCVLPAILAHYRRLLLSSHAAAA